MNNKLIIYFVFFCVLMFLFTIFFYARVEETDLRRACILKTYAGSIEKIDIRSFKYPKTEIQTTLMTVYVYNIDDFVDEKNAILISDSCFIVFENQKKFFTVGNRRYLLR